MSDTIDLGPTHMNLPKALQYSKRNLPKIKPFQFKSAKSSKKHLSCVYNAETNRCKQGLPNDSVKCFLNENGNCAVRSINPILKKIKQLQKLKCEETYTAELLKEQYALHKSYVKGRIETTKKIGIVVRLPSIPEDISENIVKQIIHNKLNDKTSRWDCAKGDLESQKEGKQECKCFTSDGPLSFTPSSHWDVIYFLDARNWLNDQFILYRIPLKRSSPEWTNIKISNTQTFQDQIKQGRRPRISWNSLLPQVQSHCTKIYEGTFDDIFIPLEVTE
jgi:hypothetical protein